VDKAHDTPALPRTQAIATETVEAIRALSPIVAVIGEHVQLHRVGVQFVGRCPFHSERTPSFYVSASKGVFKCHGCGAAGDIFRFVELLHHCSFRQSVEILATRAGIHIHGFKPSPELTAKVSAARAQREEQIQFERFCKQRIEAVNQRYRSLAREATNAEDYLRAGLPADPYIDDLAWSALERFRAFQARIELESLCDLDILTTKWEQMRNVA